MAMKQAKVIINCAVTGSVHVPSMSEYLPITPEQIAAEAIEAAAAGATTVHLHVRDPKTGQPSSDMGLFREVCAAIHDRCDVIQCTTTGGGVGMTPEERVNVVRVLEPELASMNIGSMNYGSFLAVGAVKTFKNAWEKPFLESTRDWIYANTFNSMEIFLKTMQDRGTKPELEIYDTSGLYTVNYLAGLGLIRKPYYFQFVLGVLGGIGASIENLLHLKKTADHLFGDDYTWSVLPVGRFQFPYCTMAAVMGGNVRVGMEDNLYLRKGVPLTSNAQAVEKIRRIVEDLGMEIANPAEGREILGLKGRENTLIGK